MQYKNDHGCVEYEELSRRGFLRNTGLAALAASTPAWLPRVAYAEGGATRDVMVSIYLRGGCDGLSICVPHFEDAYYDARPVNAVPRPDSGNPNACVDLDGFFGFSSGMAGLVPAYAAGDLLVVHACGSTDWTRSHFDAQHFMEVGKPRDTRLSTGWLGRHLMTTAPMSPGSLIRAMALSSSLPRTLLGGPQTAPVADPDNFRLSGASNTAAERLERLSEMYKNADQTLKAAAENTEATVDLLNAIDFAGYTPENDATYPESTFGNALKATAALIKAQVGVEAVAIDKGGWDTHVAQGTISGGMHSNMLDLGNALSAFHADLIQGSGQGTTLVMMSEFGRKLEENGSGGTDHGHGGVMFAMGRNIAGGQVMAVWPGLQPEELFEGQDLEVTIDYRDIIAEILQNRMGTTDLSVIFPDYAPSFWGVTA